MDIKKLNEELDKVLNKSREYDRFLDACEKYKDVIEEMKSLVKKYVGYDKASQQFTQEYDERDGRGGYFNTYNLSKDDFVFCSVGIVKQFRTYTVEFDITLNGKQTIRYTTYPEVVETILKELTNSQDK